MSESLDVAAVSAADLIQEDQLERVREFTREPILLEGEALADLVPGTARRRAVDAAIAELDEGHDTPSPEWRQRYSLLLGLERLLTQEPVRLAKDTELTEHQVDVLSGTLAALTAELEESDHDDRSNGARAGRSNGNGEAAANGDAAGNGAIEAIAEEDELVPDEEEPLDWEERGRGGARRGGARGPRREPALLVRARDRLRKDRCRPGLHRGLADRRRADPDPSPQPGRPVHRRDLRPRIQGSALAPAARNRATIRTARSRSRPTSGSSATRRRSPTHTRSSSATRPTRRSVRRRAPASAPGRSPYSSA